MLFLRQIPQGVEYYELSRSQPGSLTATKNHLGGLTDAEDESDARMFPVPGSERCPVKNAQELLGPSQSLRRSCFGDAVVRFVNGRCQFRDI